MTTEERLAILETKAETTEELLKKIAIRQEELVILTNKKLSFASGFITGLGFLWGIAMTIYELLLKHKLGS